MLVQLAFGDYKPNAFAAGIGRYETILVETSDKDSIIKAQDQLWKEHPEVRTMTTCILKWDRLVLELLQNKGLDFDEFASHVEYYDLDNIHSWSEYMNIEGKGDEPYFELSELMFAYVFLLKSYGASIAYLIPQPDVVSMNGVGAGYYDAA